MFSLQGLFLETKDLTPKKHLKKMNKQCKILNNVEDYLPNFSYPDVKSEQFKDDISEVKRCYKAPCLPSSFLKASNDSVRGIFKRYIEQNNLNYYVKFVPFTKNPFKYIMKSDVKVLSSRFEGNPNILLEVACLKKLIISADCNVGPREILQSEKGGFLFKVGNSEKLFYLLKNLKLNSKKIKNKIKVSYEYVAKNFQKDISISFIKLIKDI